MKDKLLGGLYGLLIGDAAGVPYEFKSPDKIPSYAPMFDLGVPLDYQRSFADVPIGTWSDDGAQALCLLESLLEAGKYDYNSFLQKLLLWRSIGYLTPDNVVFDIGNQTNRYLNARQFNAHLGDERESDRCGNGSLMRCLPIALFFSDIKQASNAAYDQSEVTHPQFVGTISCVLYTHIALNLLNGLEKEDSIAKAIQSTMHVCAEPDIARHLQTVLDGDFIEPIGSGYVVDSLWSAIYAFSRGESYEQVIGEAIRLGNDTDTTACIAGGLAGIYYGYSKIPQSYIDALRGKQIVEPLAVELLKHRGV
jgi:ADP-ribosylglycohydrolase